MSQSVEKSTQTVRAAGVAGQMYPAEPVVLTKALSELFASVKRHVFARPPLLVVAPHSALEKSGAVAASAYASLLGRKYDIVVVIAPSHSGYFPGVSVFGGESYETPLGKIPVDTSLAAELGELSPAVFDSTKEHVDGDHGAEFSLEMALPFLQMALGKFTLVPIITGDQEITSARALGDCLYSALKRKNALIVVSTDLSHYHDNSHTAVLDNLTKELALGLDAEKMINMFQAKKVEACGIVGLIAALFFAQRIGVDELEEVGYEQSVVGDGEVIGHVGIVVTRSDRQVGYTPAPDDLELSDSQPALTESDIALLHESVLKAVAVKLESRASGAESAFQLPTPESRMLKKRFGVFVSVYRQQKLVGRAGFLRSDQPFLAAACDVACAAFLDSENIPETTGAGELEKYQFKIHKLSPLSRVSDLKSLDVSSRGLLVKLEMSSAYLFPDEFADDITNAESGASTATQALEQTCLKARLPKKAYQDTRAEIYQFDIETV